MITADSVREYFRRTDWRFLERGQNAWLTGFRSKLKNYKRGFELFVVLSDPWLYFQVPFVTAIAEESRVLLYEYLLALNYRMYLAKFALESGRVVLTIEIPAATSDFAQFWEAIEAIDRYTQQYYLEVDSIAHDSALAQALVVTTRPTADLDKEMIHIEEELPEIFFNV